MKRRKYIIKTKRSRKTYLLIYLLLLFFIGYLSYLYFSGVNLGKAIWIISILIILFVIKMTEIHRFRDWWGITENSFIESKGLFSKSIREIGFSSISDLDIYQPFFKRILGYGDVNLRLFINETSLCIKNINYPEDFADILQEKIGSGKLNA